MNKVKVLVEGYARVNSDGTWDATSSTTLIVTGKLKIIMDPGCSRKLLLQALEKEVLKTGDIDYVFLSHYHLDHCLLAGIFENARVFDSSVWQKDSLGGNLEDDFLPGTDIKIIRTPGHTPDHASLLVPTLEGNILVGADIFWWEEGEEQKVDIQKNDEFAANFEDLITSRENALKIADFIIPGHGKTFKVNKG